ncbi:MAG: hypothetical protein ACPG32_09510 [Akkermansiaceae bacterium]
MYKIIIFLIFLSSGYSYSKSHDIHQHVNRIPLRHLKQIFKHYYANNNQVYPSSWSEFEQGIEKRLMPYIERADEHFNVRDRYVFIKERPLVNMQGRRVRFFVIANDSRNEGAIKGAEGKYTPGRYVYAYNKEGDVLLYRFPEKTLEAIFERSGLSLKDYTKDTNQPTEKDDTSSKTSTHEETPSSPEPAAKNHVAATEEKSGSRQTTFISLAAGCCVIVLIVYWYFRKQATK